MNKLLLCKLLGLIAVLIGGSMIFSLPWSLPACGGQWQYECEGFLGLLGAMVICFAVGAGLRHFGRNSKGQLFRKEAMAVVGLSWVLATVLGALPYTFSGTRCEPGRPMTFVDAMFEAQSGFSTTGFCTADFDAWCSFSRGVLLLLMFVGGCAGSTGGGLKVIRHIFFVKILGLEIEQAFHPSVVRPLRIAGEPVEDPNMRKNILIYFGLILAIFTAGWLFTVTVEPDETWTDHGHAVEHKLTDAASCVAATLNNIGPGLGVIGATKNYSNFTPASKCLFIVLMMIGRLEIFAIVVLFLPAFWRTQ